MRTLEIVIFKAVEGTNDEEMLAAAQNLQSVIAQRNGNISRHFGKTEAGEWVDTVMWDSMANAKAAAENIVHIPEFTPFAALIDGNTIQMRHVEIFDI